MPETYSEDIVDDEEDDSRDDYEPTGERLYDQFAEEMREKGWPVEKYQGRVFYEGPAVRTDEDSTDRDLLAAIRATTVPVQWDNMGLDYIVYPK